MKSRFKSHITLCLKKKTITYRHESHFETDNENTSSLYKRKPLRAADQIWVAKIKLVVTKIAHSLFNDEDGKCSFTVK